MRFEKPCAEMHAFFGLGCFLRYWVRYCIGTPLLVEIHILRAQKWASGHKVPAVTFWGAHTAGNGDRFSADLFANYFV